jgi:hypothetical protein
LLAGFSLSLWLWVGVSGWGGRLSEVSEDTRFPFIGWRRAAITDVIRNLELWNSRGKCPSR